MNAGSFMSSWEVLEGESVHEDEDEDEDVEGVYVGSFAFFRESDNVGEEIVQQGTAIQIVEIGIPEL